MPEDDPVSLDEIAARLEKVLAASPADATDVSWLEARRGQESNGKRRRDTFEHFGRTVLIRVRQSGRCGLHRTSACGASDLENGLREALAQARLAPPSPPPLAPPGAGAPAPALPGSFDPELARMNPARARDLVQRLAAKGETARCGWAEGRMAVLNSQGLRRAAEVTSGWVEVICGRGPGAGRAASASRSLAGLDPREVFERARRRHGPPEVVPPPDGPVPLVLSQESVAVLVELLNRLSLTSDSFHSGVSFLRDELGNRVLHSAVHLRDDPTDPTGLPFPFDAFGSATRPVDLIEEGVALTPAMDSRLARQLDRPPTPHLVAPDEAIATHLFLRPGGRPNDELLRAAEGGLWVAALEPIECFDPGAPRFRAVARGVRRISGGVPGRAVPDLVWEDNLREVFNRILAIGSEPVTVALGGGLLGAVTAPPLALERAASLRIAIE
jgi:predicted Zn-dependent protease